MLHNMAQGSSHPADQSQLSPLFMSVTIKTTSCANRLTPLIYCIGHQERIVTDATSTQCMNLNQTVSSCIRRADKGQSSSSEAPQWVSGRTYGGQHMTQKRKLHFHSRWVNLPTRVEIQTRQWSTDHTVCGRFRPTSWSDGWNTFMPEWLYQHFQITDLRVTRTTLHYWSVLL